MLTFLKVAWDRLQPLENLQLLAHLMQIQDGARDSMGAVAVCARDEYLVPPITYLTLKDPRSQPKAESSKENLQMNAQD